MFWEVKAGVGLGDLRLGATREEVETYLGVPEQIAEDTMAGGLTVAWYYWGQGITAHFDAGDDYRLGMLQVSNPDVVVDGKHFIGMPQQQLLGVLGTPHWGQIDIDADPDWPSVSADEWGLTFILRDGKVESLQINTLMDENEKEIWPD